MHCPHEAQPSDLVSMASACLAWVPGSSKFCEMIIMLLMYSIAFLKHWDAGCTVVQTWRDFRHQVSYSASWTKHVPITIPVSTETAHTTYLRLLEPSTASLDNRLSYRSSQLFASIERNVLSQVWYVIAVVYRFLAGQECRPYLTEFSYTFSSQQFCATHTKCSSFQVCCRSKTRQLGRGYIHPSWHTPSTSKLADHAPVRGLKSFILPSCNKDIFFCRTFTCE